MLDARVLFRRTQDQLFSPDSEQNISEPLNREGKRASPERCGGRGSESGGWSGGGSGAGGRGGGFHIEEKFYTNTEQSYPDRIDTYLQTHLNRIFSGG